jgi:hypothetical protein
VIVEVVRVLQTLSPFYLGPRQAIETARRGVVKYTLHVAADAGILCDAAYPPMRLSNLLSQFQPFAVVFAFVGQLHPAGLDREVRLCLSYLDLTGVSVHGDEVASVPREDEIAALTRCSTSDVDQFLGLKEMVTDSLTDTQARLLCPLYHLLEVLPVVIAEKRLQSTRSPVFAAIGGSLPDHCKRTSEPCW